MDSEYINTLKEMVLDEEKLVTYLSLSKDLCMHTNESKLLLNKLVNEADAIESLSINYIISGLTEDNKALTKVCLKSDLDDQRKQFQSLFFEHIYSVAKGKPCVDNAAYMSVNRFEDFPLYTGLIKSNSCIKRSSTEIGDLISNSQQKSVAKESVSTVQLQKKEKKELNAQKLDKIVTKPIVTKSEPIIKNEAPSPKKDSKQTSPKQNIKKNGKTQKGITGFFGKSNSTPAEKVRKLDVIKQEKTIINRNSEDQTKEKTEKLKIDKSPAHAITNEEVIKDPKPKQTIKKEKSNNKALAKIKENAKVDKKRKRVLKVSDSESDEETSPFVDEPAMDVDNDSADEIPATPTINTVKITSGIINPKKKRKIVDKTYMDDEGYILTKKVEVYESCSDNEEVTKENAPKNILIKTEASPKETKVTSKTTKKKISPPQKGKQVTMMNYFKKK